METWSSSHRHTRRHTRARPHVQPHAVRLGPLRHNIDTPTSHAVPSPAGATRYLFIPFTSDLLPCLLPIFRS